MNTRGRKKETWLWRLLSFSAIALTVLLAAGFGYGYAQLAHPASTMPTMPDEQLEGSPPVVDRGLAERDEVLVAAIGDSLTRGTGDRTGQGYVRQTVAGLQEKLDKPVRLLNNLAINGLRADELAERLATDEGMRYAISQADVVLLTIGGNDLFQFAQGLTPSPSEQDLRQFLDTALTDEQLEEASERLADVFARIHELNPEARVIYLSLYNPFYGIPELREGSLRVQAWNEKAYELAFAYANMTVVPVYDLFELSIGKHLSSDQFHPNNEGYRLMAERIVQVLE